MSNIKQITTFEQGGLDTDSSFMWMGKNDSPYYLNAMVSEDGNAGVRVNLQGNRQITYNVPLVLSNTYAVKGGYYNNLTRKLYFFVVSQPYDSGAGVYLYDNRLLCFNEDAETIDTIFIDQKNYLGIDPGYILTDMKMIETWLFYNPVTSEPRMIDVEMAYNYTNYPAWDATTDPSLSAVLGDTYTWRGGLFVANTTITASEDPSTSPTKWDRIGSSYQDESSIGATEFSRAFYAIKTPPLDRITTSYGSDTTKNFNNVDGMMFRFCHRYQYFDNSYSVCSAFSQVTRPTSGEVYNGAKTGSTTLNNYINLNFSLYSAALVKNIELFFQDIDGTWKRMAVINRQDQSLLDDISYTHRFYNNSSYPVIDQDIPYVVYDAVPKLASAQEIINKNVLCFAGCTEGFDNIDKDLIDVTLTPTIHEITSVFGENTLRWDLLASITDYVDPTTPDIYYKIIDINTLFATMGVTAGDIFAITRDGFAYEKILEAADVVSATSLANAMHSVINESIVITDSGVKLWVYRDYSPPDIPVCRIYEPEATLSSLTKKGGFKTQAYHPFCLYYFDNALRRSDAQVVDDMKIYVPSINDYSPPVTETNYRWSIDWEIEHEPPTWAKYWKWGYAGNSRCTRFTQYIVSAVAASGASEPLNTVSVDITPLQTVRTTTETNWNVYPNSIIPLYEFTEGDRIRFMTKATTPATTGTTLGDAIDGIYDFEIIKFDETTNKIYVQSFNFGAATIGVNTLVEIYSPNKNDLVQTYYEFGDLMPIRLDVDGNRVHGGQIQDQVLTASPLPATGSFEYGDVYHILRTPSKPLCTFNATQLIVGAFHETQGWSDFYSSDDWDKGKLGLESPLGEVKLNIIRYSNPYLQNTTVNGITTFEANHFKELNDTYGDISAIVEVGNTLKVYQEKKQASIGIGRTEYQDANGEITVVGSDQVLGVIRYSNKNYGTTFPESVVKNNRYVYGFDAYQGTPWRDTPNGIHSLGGRYEELGGAKDYKMSSYFKAKAKALLQSGVEHCNVFSVWDERHDMLYIVFKDLVNKENNDTVVFHEPSDRWVTFTEMEYTPVGGFNEMLELSYEVVKGFENGIGYVFDEETRFATFNIGSGLGTNANVNISVDTLEIEMSLPDPVITIINAPDAPTIQSATDVDGTSFYANWLASATATGYRLDVATDVAFTSFVAGYNNLDVSNVLTYDVTGLTADTTYYFRVRAYSAVGTSPSSSSQSQRTSAPPATVVATSATSITTTSFYANWNAASGAEGYYLDVATDAGFTSFVTGYNNRNVGNVTTYMILGLSSASTYYFRVRSFNLKGQVAVSSNTITTSTLPAIPVATAATSVLDTGFTANWNAAPNVDGYKLDVATDSGFTSMVSGFSNLDVANVTTYAVTGLAEETTYYYRVRSYKGATVSGNSNTVSQRTSLPPDAPVAASGTSITATSFYANWGAVTGASGYYLDVATDSGFTTFAAGYNNRDIGNVLTYYIRSLVTGINYYYRVRSHNLKGQVSASSNTITVTTL